MKVRELMSTDPVTCSSSDHLGTAALRMWGRDCGVLPVTQDGRVVGVVTDRDIAMALSLRGARAADVEVGEVISPRVFSCDPDEDVTSALAVMGEHQVHRLPVTEHGRLVGVLALNDIVLATRAIAGGENHPTYGQVMKTLQSICTHRALAAA